MSLGAGLISIVNSVDGFLLVFSVDPGIENCDVVRMVFWIILVKGFTSQTRILVRFMNQKETASAPLF